MLSEFSSGSARMYLCIATVSHLPPGEEKSLPGDLGARENQESEYACGEITCELNIDRELCVYLTALSGSVRPAHL